MYNNCFILYCVCIYKFSGSFFFFFQAEDGIRDAQESRGLGDVYKRQVQLLTSLAFLQQHGYIHADIKPENILMVHDPNDGVQLKLIDFGNAMHVKDQKLYHDDFEVQSLFYRAPEVLVGKSFTGSIDIWSLGCVLYELCCGKPLFEGSTREAVVAAQVSVLGPYPANVVADGQLTDDIDRTCQVTAWREPHAAHHTDSQKINSVLRLLEPAKNVQFADFLLSCLQYDPAERFSPRQALCHGFISQLFPFAVVFGTADGSKGATRRTKPVVAMKSETCTGAVSQDRAEPSGSHCLRALQLRPAHAAEAKVAGAVAEVKQELEATGMKEAESKEHLKADMKPGMEKALVKTEDLGPTFMSQTLTAGEFGAQRAQVQGGVVQAQGMMGRAKYASWLNGILTPDDSPRGKDQGLKTKQAAPKRATAFPSKSEMMGKVVRKRKQEAVQNQDKQDVRSPSVRAEPAADQEWRLGGAADDMSQSGEAQAVESRLDDQNKFEEHVLIVNDNHDRNVHDDDRDSDNDNRNSSDRLNRLSPVADQAVPSIFDTVSPLTREEDDIVQL
eukprot:TRINITY_DN20264_c0_g1_i2.p1 TRINITY_DN20264_c0_g1~~TRINITY_DN20264_c0_g1_i2.p1  ORF type:complete len:558 (-),score=115.57 TRINITY_DN20264_c0_g1_i2:219-1892(-)